MRKTFFIILVMMCCCPVLSVWADSLTMPMVATGILSIGDIVINLVFGLCYVTGITLVFMTIIFFRRYRQNPIETPISKVFWTFTLGIVIFILPFIAHTVEIYQTMEDASEQNPRSIN